MYTILTKVVHYLPHRAVKRTEWGSFCKLLNKRYSHQYKDWQDN